MTRNTPAPWWVHWAEALGTWVVKSHRGTIAEIRFQSESENKANVRLLAAAPDNLDRMMRSRDILDRILKAGVPEKLYEDLDILRRLMELGIIQATGDED